MSGSRYDAGPLRAGAAQVDITPDRGVHLAGSVGTYRPARVVGDPLFARAVAFECGGRKLCLLTLDVTIVTEEYTRCIRQAAAEIGFDPDAVMVHATQTHSAPSLGHIMVDPDFADVPDEFEWIRGSDSRYNEWAAGRAIEAIRRANAALEPCEIGAGSGIEGRLSYNRRAVMRDGSISMPARAWQGGALGPTGIRYIEGPIDPEVGVLCVRTPSLRVPALLLHHTCHPVHVFPKPVVSADWPGAWCREAQARHGETCAPLVLNGACGNINPWPPFDPDYAEDHHRFGRILAEMSAKVVETLTFSGEGVVDWGVRRLPIPLRELPTDELKWARGVLEAQPQPAWVDKAKTTIDGQWMAAASIYSVHLMQQRQKALEYEIQVLRVGDTAIVGLPGEPFVEGQLRIKLASPAYPTYVAHCTSQYVGYIPTPEALERGGHEASTRYWVKLVPEALEMIVSGATELLHEVFPKQPGVV